MSDSTSPAPAAFAVLISDVYFSYAAGKKRIDVLGGFDLSVADGEFVCILGPSGSGKSTILNLIAGFVRPESGSVLCHGQAVAGPGPDRGVVFQEFVLFPWRSARGNVASGLEFARLGASEISSRVSELLESVGLDGFGDHYPAALSGGMQQRVALARTLATNPNILLMDEPFGALDAQTRQSMQALLLNLWETDRQTIIFVTHDVDEALYLADRIVVISERPARVRKIFQADIGRPRGKDLFSHPNYIRTKRDILDMLFS